MQRNLDYYLGRELIPTALGNDRLSGLFSGSDL
jgi:hypothetical protein